MEERSSKKHHRKGTVSLTVGVTGALLSAAIFWLFIKRGTYSYEYYIVGNSVLLFFIPMVTIFILGEDAGDFGFGIGNWRKVRWWTLAMFAAMLVILIPVSRLGEFQAYYPIFRRFGSFMDAGAFVETDRLALIYGWISYGMYMFFWEFFFRGYLLFGLAKSMKWVAILVQALPFVLLHSTKPSLEFAAALPAGIILGVLAWQSKSFLPCFLLHWAVQIASDVLVMAQRHPGH